MKKPILIWGIIGGLVPIVWRVLVTDPAAECNPLCWSGVFNIDQRKGKNAKQVSMSFPKNVAEAVNTTKGKCSYAPVVV